MGAKAMQFSFDFAERRVFDPKLYEVAARSSGEAHGVVLTKPHIVELMLDLVGYDARENLSRRRLLEPSVGHGAFLRLAVRRLMSSALRHGVPAASLDRCIVAMDIDAGSVAVARETVADELHLLGVSRQIAARLCSNWIQHGDFLLHTPDEPYDVVIGNPPYVRIEHVHIELQREYRSRFQTVFDRADLYVPFIEHGLSLLSPDGRLSYICSDRWTLNKYGAPLRNLMTSEYAVQDYVDLHNASPFESDVNAYPCIFVVGRTAPSEGVRVATLTRADEAEVQQLRAELVEPSSRPSLTPNAFEVHRHWFRGGEPWIIRAPESLALLRKLENAFAPLAETCRPGIGVATGNDSLFIVRGDCEIEPDRLLPLVMRENLVQGRIQNVDRYVINTFPDGRGALELDQYPRLRAYLMRHEAEIRRRHVSGKNAVHWYRTIDRVYPELTRIPKLLFPDICATPTVVLDKGEYYPHHNLYYVTSEMWDMEVLGALLSSCVTMFFMRAYSVKMRGDFVRFQAQNLRRLRLPAPTSLTDDHCAALATAFRAQDRTEIDRLACKAYGLSDAEMGIVLANQ